jgi:hypothetical protein
VRILLKNSKDRDFCLPRLSGLKLKRKTILDGAVIQSFAEFHSSRKQPLMSCHQDSKSEQRICFYHYYGAQARAGVQGTGLPQQRDMLAHGSIKGRPHRYVVPVMSGFIEGPNLKADLTSGSSDWLLLDTSTGTAQLDYCANARIKEGECILRFLFITHLYYSTFIEECT